jgi:FPC/CPF motif-containing protein YcgG
LYEFCNEFREVGSHFVTFIAGFGAPRIESELHLEGLLWQQLQRMHEIDRRHFCWDPKVADDPDDPQFSFSIGGRGFFIVGLHPQASRRARTLPTPMLVFNLHEQFDRLRERGKFETIKQMIRARDIAYHGSINPVLTDFGQKSEARQYSGRAVPDDWACPFHRILEDDTK